MPEKIKSKDLSYDSTLPPFLQRLRDQHSGCGDPDRHERPTARPKKAKDPNDDDGPTVVDESGETITKEEFDKLAGSVEDTPNVKGGFDPDAEPEASGALRDQASIPTRYTDSKVTDGVAPKKRKAIRVIGEDETVQSGKNAAKKPTKKAKKAKVKLSYDDEDEGS